MGRVEIFKIELVDSTSGGRMTLAGGREFDGDFYLDFGTFFLPLFLGQASSFARAVALLAWRRQRAAPKAGSAWRRNIGDGVNAGFRLEFGLSDQGHVYVESGSTKICCDAAQNELLLTVLVRFAEDVNSISTMLGGHAPRADEHDPIVRLVRMLPA
jgi:hypothetical protein